MTRLFFSLYVVIVLSLITLSVGLEQLLPVSKPALNESEQAWLKLLQAHRNQPRVLTELLDQAGVPHKKIPSQSLALGPSVSASLARGELVHGFYEQQWKIYIPVHKSEVITATFSYSEDTSGYWWLYSSLFFILLGVVIAVWIYPLWRDLGKLVKSTRKLETDGSLHVPALSRSSPLYAVSYALDELSQNVKTLLHNQRELTGAVTHEFKTPLARMKFALATDAGLNADQVQDLISDVDELDALVQEMLDFTRLNVLEPDLLIESIPLIALCQQRINALTIRKDINITVTGDEVELIADSHLVARALDNLLTNAVRHATERVVVVVTADTTHIELHVDDDGPGIPEEHKSAVFDAFYRPDPARSRQGGGAGLGLAIVRRVMQWHGGMCSAADSSLGGARLTLQFKRAAPASSDDAVATLVKQ
ncbi:ATP-binding protein [Alteromonas sp. ASW11-19]|uniref:histidine kinase n=1 Tax=Alteromonas salexigens TaxID=2982530 RepID=A0ABT2VPV6_9ALTE|nr:ATP-binding protein [Alteromonas salexigens]MCU7555349.1 ATP-binding protein [Alteromonas salexigens]